MKLIEYERHEFHGEPEARKAVLSIFVYDIPYFGACGIFPPIQIINQIFESGGSEGGMGPGATWRPFSVSKKEYSDLVSRIQDLDPKTLGDKARYITMKFEFDDEFDEIEEWETWILEVSQKYRGN